MSTLKTKAARPVPCNHSGDCPDVGLAKWIGLDCPNRFLVQRLGAESLEAIFCTIRVDLLPGRTPPTRSAVPIFRDWLGAVRMGRHVFAADFANQLEGLGLRASIAWALPISTDSKKK